MKKEFTTIGLTDETKQILDKLKVHPRQSYNELILLLVKERGMELTKKEKIVIAEEEDEEEISEENDARCGIASLVLPEHPELVLFRPVRAMSRSLLWDAPVFEQVIDVEA